MEDKKIDEEQIRMLKSLINYPIRDLKRKQQDYECKFWYHRIDEAFLQYSNIFNISFVEVCTKFGVNYELLQKMRDGDIEAFEELKFKVADTSSTKSELNSKVTNNGYRKDTVKNSNLTVDSTKSVPEYKCGHKPNTIILDCNELSITAWYEWKDSVGFDGDKSQCWECWCKEDTKSELCNHCEHEGSFHFKDDRCLYGMVIHDEKGIIQTGCGCRRFISQSKGEQGDKDVKS